MQIIIALSELSPNGFKFLVLTGISIFVIIVYYTVNQFLKRKKYSHIRGPTTNGILGFYTGHLVELNESIKKDVPLSLLMHQWFEKFGPVYKVQFLHNIFVSVNDASAIKQITIDEDFPKYEFLYNLIAYPFGTRGLGNGLVTIIDQEKWKNKRALFNHGFQRNFLISCSKDFNDKTNTLMEKLRTLADGKTCIPLFKDINRFALDVISSVFYNKYKVAFSIETGAINDPKAPLNSLIGEFTLALRDILRDPILAFKPHKRSQVNEYRKSIKELRDFSRKHILQRLKEIENKEPVPNDILSIIINSSSEQMDLEELVDDFLTIFGAGQETTANSLAFTILELGRNPHCLERARLEIDEIIGSKIDLNYEDLSKLEYTSCILKESLRKWPPAAELSRISTKDIELNGVFIPKNTWIVMSPYVMGRNERNFPDPEKFEPERFLKGSKIAEKNTVTSYTYFPFSLGPRNCIGQNFAQLEEKMFLVKFIQNFDFTLDPEQSFNVSETFTLRPKDGCRIFLRPRKHNVF